MVLGAPLQAPSVAYVSCCCAQIPGPVQPFSCPSRQGPSRGGSSASCVQPCPAPPPHAQPEVHTRPPSTADKQGPVLWPGALGLTSQIQHGASGVTSHTSALIRVAPRPLLTGSWQGEGSDEPGEQVASQRPAVFSQPVSLGISSCRERVSCVSTSRPPFLREKSRRS